MHVLALLRFVKTVNVFFSSFWFRKCYYLCHQFIWPLLKICCRVDSCIKVYFEPFGSMRTNLWSITYLVLQGYCFYFLVVCCLYFFKNNRQFSSFSVFKMVATKSRKPWTYVKALKGLIRLDYVGFFKVDKMKLKFTKKLSSLL